MGLLTVLIPTLLAAPVVPGPPVTFEENRGQAAPEVRYFARTGGAELYLTPAAVVTRLGGQVVRMELAGAHRRVSLEGSEPAARRSNYLQGRDPARWVTGAPHYRRVTYRGAYPGIDLVFHAPAGRLEYDLVVSPGADPGRVELRFAGADGLMIDGHGDLLVLAGLETLRHRRPVASQDGRQVAADFELAGDRSVRFRLGQYDRGRPLLIDPILIFSTFLGTAVTDSVTDIAVDDFGSAYVCGFTTSPDFPVEVPYQDGPNAPGALSAFVSKLTPDGRELLYSTYLGGSGVSWAEGIAVDASGRAVVVGWSEADDFPTRLPIQARSGGGTDAFIARLSATADALERATLFGGSGDEKAWDVHIDRSGDIHVAGETTSTNLPLVNALDGTLGGSRDAFVLKATAALDGYVYTTYFGGSGIESAYGIATDADRAAHFAGETGSTDMTVGRALQGSLSGPRDAFAAKLRTDGEQLLYSTYLGGGGADMAQAMAADGVGNAYVVGRATAGFPTKASLYPEIGTSFIFVTKILPAGLDSVWSTYIGTSVTGMAQGVAVAPAGDVYVAGWAAEFGGVSEFPRRAGVRVGIQAGFGGGTGDAFLVRIDPSGTFLRFSSLFGGTQGDEATGVALLPGTEEAYIGGLTFGGTYPTTLGAFDITHGGANDGFVARLDTFDQPDSPDYLTLGVSRPASLTGAARQARFRVVAPPGLRLTLTLTGSDPLDDNALYARYRAPAEPFAHDFAADRRGQASQRLVIATTRPGECHILLQANGIAGPASDVTILAEAAELALESMSPDHTDAGAPIHAAVHGGGFVDGMSFALERGNVRRQAAEVRVVSPGEAHMTFDLASAGGGAWRLTAAAPSGATASRDGALTVTKTLLPGILAVRVSAADTCRRERHVRLTVHYENVGSREMPAPLLILTPSAGVGLRLEKDVDLPTAAIQVLAVNPDGPAGVLPPGASGSIPIIFRPKSAVPASFRLSLFAPREWDLIPWATMAAPPGFAAQLWTDELKMALSGLLGATWSEYVASLGEAADRLARRGQYPAGVRDAMRLVLAEALGTVPTSAFAGQLVHSPTGKPYAGRTVLALEDGAIVSSAPTDFRGRFVLPCLEPGHTYDLGLLSGAIAAPPATIPPEGGDVVGVVIRGVPRPGSVPLPPSCERSVPLAPPLVLPPDAIVPLFDIAVDVRGSHDPNEKDGPEGEGPDKLVSVDSELLYTIYFENLGNGNAQTVTVGDFLDRDLDWSTFRPREAGVGAHVISLDAGDPASSTAVSDAYSASNIAPAVSTGTPYSGVEARCDFNPLTGEAKWTFETIDPLTGARVPATSLDGFLPPNSTPPAGEGWVSFTVEPKDDAPDGTEVRNQSTISFDGQQAILTEPVINRISRNLGQLAAPSNPNPLDNVVREIDPSGLVLGWQGDSRAVSFDVYLWHDREPAPTTPTAADLTTARYVPTRVIDFSSVYHWRVVQLAPDNKRVNGPVWSFLTAAKPPAGPAAPTLISPAQGATGLPTSPRLQWGAAARADAYSIYLWPHGEAPTLRPVAAGVTGTSLIVLPSLDDRTRYDWQVEAINRGGRARSAVGTFATGVPLPSGGFRRGDVNADTSVDIADPISTLGFLFLGSPRQLSCDDAADAADDGVLDLTDAVAVLSFLFLGSTRSLPPPFTACGEDPTADALGCDGFSPCE